MPREHRAPLAPALRHNDWGRRIGSAPPISQFKIATLAPSRCVKSRLEGTNKALSLDLSRQLPSVHPRAPCALVPARWAAKQPRHRSARARSEGGMVRPSALAVLRLITNSNLVGSWIWWVLELGVRLGSPLENTIYIVCRPEAVVVLKGS